MAALALVLVAGWVSKAVAAAGADATSGGDRPARVLFERAETRFSVGRFAEAAIDYERAYEIEPLPGLLFNVAQCYRNMGDYERASFVYRRYVALEPRGANRRIANDLIAEMDRRAAEARGGGIVSSTAAVGLVSGVKAGATRPAPVAQAPFASRLSQTRDESRNAFPGSRRWWVLTGVGALLVGGVVAAMATSHDDAPWRPPRAMEPRP